MTFTMIAAAVVVVLLVVLALSVAARRRENASPQSIRPAPPAERAPVVDTSGDGMAEVVRLARTDRKIQAIKLYRDLTHVGLKEAKDSVERLMVGLPPVEAPRPEPSGDGMAEVVRLARTDRKIQAIKLYRDLTHVGLKEAKDSVERLMVGLPPGPAAVADERLAEVDALIAQDRLIQAIKVYREMTGASLKQAKYAVEARRDAGTHLL
ncbi:ribosomal protein L7/L12 [Actinocatenispora rupis]|uniref:Large ribosomal subunit protein bL12 C-terminal domain-containing protein n=1 Tax=Actinocatenispora rupis TaxID=519421 RepID=A0A8J3JCK6_9ACTN|nr:ribosomal protein L7/L12 [Actinocatenispora rupis]GID13513.1 hypothetical protein Aru02nite_44020 [Actinocatenispora rupis]